MFVRSAVLCIAIAARQGVAHVGGDIPPSRWDPGNKYGMRDGWRNAHVGPMNCDGDQCKPDSPKGTGASPNHWYSNFTFIPGEPVDADADWRTSPLRTYFWHDVGYKLGWNAVRALRKHPWRAPGHSPISNPCGIASGTVPGLPGGGDGHGKPPAVPTGYKRAMNGTDLPELEGGPTSWSESSNAADALCHVNIF